MRACVRACVCVCMCVCVCVVSVIVKRPVLPPSVVDGRSKNPLYYHYYYIWAMGGGGGGGGVEEILDTEMISESALIFCPTRLIVRVNAALNSRYTAV